MTSERRKGTRHGLTLRIRHERIPSRVNHLHPIDLNCAKVVRDVRFAGTLFEEIINAADVRIVLIGRFGNFVDPNRIPLPEKKVADHFPNAARFVFAQHVCYFLSALHGRSSR